MGSTFGSQPTLPDVAKALAQGNACGARGILSRTLHGSTLKVSAFRVETGKQCAEIEDSPLLGTLFPELYSPLHRVNAFPRFLCFFGQFRQGHRDRHFPYLGKNNLPVCSCIGPHKVCNSIRVRLALTSVAWLPPRSWAAFWTGPHRWRHATGPTPSPVGFRRYGVTATPLPLQSAGAPLVVIVTPAVFISFFRPEFEDFLHAPIGMESNEMLLSVLSALARLNLDPWKEAAELSELPKEPATKRLAALIVRLPGGRWTQSDSMRIAHRLIELLPRRSNPSVPLIERAHGTPRMPGSPTAKMLICAALAGMALIIAASCETSSGADMVISRMTEAAPHSQSMR